MGKSFDPIGLAGGMRDAELLNSTPRPIVSMSFQLAIPWRVALPQSPPPLHQPGTIMQQRAAAGHQKPANGQQCLNYLSHPRGQAQTAVSLACMSRLLSPTFALFVLTERVWACWVNLARLELQRVQLIA